MRKSILFVLAAFLIAAGPKVSTKKTSAPAKEIWPLKTGNVWIYKTTMFDEKGKLSLERYDTLTVLNDLLVGSELFYKVQTVESTDKNTYVEFMINRDDGFYSHGENKDKARYTSYFKYPCSVGDTMKIAKDNMLLDSNNAKVNTSAGSFTCYKYVIEYKTTQGKNVFYFSPGQGMINYESFKKNKLTFKRELVKLNIK